MKAMINIFLAPFRGMTKKQKAKAVFIGVCLALVMCGLWVAAIPLVCVALPRAAKKLPNVQE